MKITNTMGREYPSTKTQKVCLFDSPWHDYRNKVQTDFCAHVIYCFFPSTCFTFFHLWSTLTKRVERKSTRIVSQCSNFQLDSKRDLEWPICIICVRIFFLYPTRVLETGERPRPFSALDRRIAQMRISRNLICPKIPSSLDDLVFKELQFVLIFTSVCQYSPQPARDGLEMSNRCVERWL